MLGVYSSAAKYRLRSVISLVSGVALAFGFLAFTGAPNLAQAYEVSTGTWSNPVNDSSTISFPSGLTATVSSSGRTDVTGVSTLGAKEWATGIYSPSTMVTGDSGVAVLVNTGTCAATGTCTGLGTLTVTFNRPVRNPTFDFSGIGGTSGGTYWSALHAVLTSTTPGITLSRASGNSQFAVSSNQITATDNRTSAVCVTVGPTGYTASCGSVQAIGTSSTFSFDVSAVFTAMAGRGSNSSSTGDEIILAVSVPQDFGDAPASYDQTQAAAHIISGLYLGSNATEDNADVRNASTSPNAGAGASADSDDAFSSLPDIAAQPGLAYSLTVPISGVTASSTVCGWLDFNRNGVFDTTAASGEQGCATVAAGAANATLTWTVPSGASVGSTYARFRIGNSAAEITGKPTGLATTGEVEDYPVNIVAMPTITLRKTTTAGTGGAFGFTLTNTSQTTGTITTTASDTPTQVDGDTATAGAQPFTAAAINTAVTITESQLASGWAFSAASCTSGGTSVGTLSGTTMTLPAAAIVPGADIICDYTNGQPAISLTKTAGSLSGLTAGSTLPYTFTVTNTGQTPLNSIAITDSKIATVTCDATALAIGASTTCTGTYTLKQSDVDAGQVVNNASVSGAPPTGSAVVATATSTKTITSAAAISLTKTAGTLSGDSAGSTLPYTFTVTNTGNVTLTGITITDTQVSGLTCDATTLAPTASTTCSATHTVSQDEVDAGTIVNNATVSGAPPSGPATTSTATSTTTIARSTSITLSKTAGTPTGMAATETIPYSFTVTNTGNVTLTAVSITDAQTAGVTCTATTLAPNASTDCTGTHTITQAELDAGSVTNNASVTATPPSGMSAPTDTASATSDLTRTADATLDKQFSGTTGWSVGDVASYTFVVTNTGNVTLTDIGITDSLTTGMNCPATTLAPGVSTTCTAEHTLTQAEVDAGHLYNSATLSATPPTGVSAVSVTDDLDTPITAGPTLTLEKTASAPSVAAKDGVIDYSFLVTNTGNVTLTDVNITDARALNLTCPQTTLAPQASTTCTGEHTLTQAEVDAGSVTNTATVDALSPTGTHATATDSVTSTITRTSSLLLDKQAGTPTDSVPGATIPYTFAVKNTGNVTVTGVTVDDSQLTSVTCPTTPLAPGATMNCAGTYTLTQSDVDAGGVPNSATATATPPSGVTPPTSNTDDTVTSIDRDAALDFTKTAGAPTGNTEGGTITYTFAVANAGNVTLTEVGIDDPQLGPVACPSTSLAPGASMTCTAVYPITQADVDAGGVHNVATAAGTAPSGVTSPSVDASADTTLTRAPSLSLVKQTSGTVPTVADSDISYEFLVTNTGNVTLTDVSVTDAKVGAVTCPAGDLAPGATTTCTASYTLLQSDIDTGSVENSATASATPPSGVTTTPTAGDTVTTTIPASPSIEVVKSASAVVDANSSSRDDAGDTITYTFTVTNTGNVTLTGVDIDDPKVGTVTCPETTLAPGAQTTCTQGYTLLQSDVDAGTVVNNATASGTPPTGAAVTDAATAASPLTRSASLAFDKQAGTPSGSQAGSTIAYTFVLTNTGNVTLTGVGVTDAKVGTVTCPVTTLAPGASTTCTTLYTITQADVDTGAVSNTATGHGTAPSGVTSPDVDDATTTPLAQNPRVSMDKQSGGVADANGSGTVDAGDTITYTFVATNTGNVTLDPVTIHDPLLFSTDLDCGLIAVGASKTCGTAVYTLTQADVDAGHVVNNASASGLAPDGSTSSPTATDTTDTPVTATSAIAVSKSASAPADTNASGRTDVGDTITYTFDVTNTGSATLNSVTVADPKATLSGCSLGSLAPGATASCTGTHVLTLADLNAGTLSNTATATGIPSNGEAVSNTATVDSTIAQAPSLSIVKKATTAESELGQVGDVIDYTFTVTNTGTVTLTAVGVNDAIIDPVTCPVTTLNPGVTTTCTGSYSLTQADVDAGSVVNSATASGTEPGGSPITADSNEVTSSIASDPQIHLVKSAGAIVDANGSGSVDAGDSIDYTFTVTNPGNVTLDSVAVTDTLIPALSCSTSSLNTLADDATAALTCTATYILTQDDVNAGTVANTATAAGNPPVGDAVDSTSSTTTPITRTASLAFDKQAPTSVGSTPASTVSYDFVVTNTGTVTITSIAISDDLTGTPSCPSEVLQPGETMTCTATHSITQAEIDSGSVTNHASVTGTAPAGVTAPTASDDTATSITRNPGITVAKSASVPTGNDADSSTIDYTFTVTNTGNVTVTDVSVTDPLIPTLACTVASLAPGATKTCTATYTITQSDADARQVTNTATVEATDAAGDPISNTSTAVTTDLPETPAVDLSKSYDSVTDTNGNGVTDAGDVFHYTLTATNTGNVTLAAVTITDSAATLSDCAAVDGLAPQATTSCTGTHVLTQAEVDSGSLTNTGDVSASSPGGATVQGSDAVNTPIAEVPGLTIVKTAGAASGAQAGSTIPYTFTVTNTGNVTLSGIVVTDTKITTGITCPDDTLAPQQAMACTATYRLTQDDVNTGTVVNTASVTGNPPAGDPVTDDSDPITSTIDAEPGLNMVKAAGATTDVNGNGLVDLGDTVAYTFTVSNTGNVTLSGIVVNDSKVPSVTCPATSVLPGASLTCTGSHVLTQPEIDAGAVINTATVIATPPSGPAVGATSNTVTSTLPSQPSVSLDKQAGSIVDANANGLTDAGDTISYTFAVTNTGNVTLNPIQISDAKAVLDSTCDTLAPLAPEASATCTGIHTLTQAEADSGASNNTATLTATPPVGPAITATDSTATSITSTPGLTLDKTVGSITDLDGDGPTAGDTIHYSFTVANTGNVTLDPIVLTDARAELDASCGTLGPLQPGATANCTGQHLLSQSDVDSGHYANSASATGTSPSGSGTSTGDTTDTSIPAQPGIEIVKSASAPSAATAGSTITYTFDVTNTGNVTLSGIVVTDTKITTGVTCPDDTLAPQEAMACTATYRLTQDDVNTGTVVNTASVTGNPPAGDPVTDDSDPITSTIDTEPGLNIVKSASRPSDNIAGATIDYTFTVTNTGNVTLTGIGVTDPLITTVNCLADTLDPTAETTCTGTHVLSQAEVDSGAVLNTATAHGTSPQGTDIAEDSNQVTTDIPSNPGVSVDKSAGAPSGNNAGDTIVYTVTVTNTGNVTVTGIGVDDPHIDDITCAETTVAPGVATTCTGTYTLTQADIDNGSVTNTATAEGTSPAGDPVSGISNTVNTNIVATPGIDLVKTGSASGERAGDTVNYSFTVSNTGNVTLTDLVISDPLISSISCPQTQLAPTSATVCTGSYTLTQADVDAGSVHNDAEASADTPHSGTVTAADGTDVSIAPGPGLDLVKQAGAVIDVDNNGVDTGDLLPYTFTVTNTGNVTMTSVAIQDPKISEVSCPAGSLAPGETLSCTGSYPLSQADVDAGAVINSAKATALGPNADPDLPLHPVFASDSVTTPIDQHPALSLTKSSNAKGTLKVSSTVVFTFLVTNTGNVVLNDITVADPMLKSVSCPVQTLQPGQSTVCTGSPYTVTAQDAAKGKLVNTAIASTGFCPAAGCSTVSAQSTVRLAVAKNTHLAYTGAEVSRSLMLGGAILLAGMVLVFAARRRRHND